MLLRGRLKSGSQEQISLVEKPKLSIPVPKLPKSHLPWALMDAGSYYQVEGKRPGVVKGVPVVHRVYDAIFGKEWFGC
ncbi:hypothetical protein [Sphingobacterium sp. HMA12]|jgi:hypothetical protein|uniref:hypothetical protein n=1 Tax=Sphingobacterium sp. HMA12 TaxID=2050894 RepID=UPI000CEA3A93|nr:hypothetical protein [Sphingobacterium sp. HMA12]